MEPTGDKPRSKRTFNPTPDPASTPRTTTIPADTPRTTTLSASTSRATPPSFNQAPTPPRPPPEPPPGKEEGTMLEREEQGPTPQSGSTRQHRTTARLHQEDEIEQQYQSGSASLPTQIEEISWLLWDTALTSEEEDNKDDTASEEKGHP